MRTNNLSQIICNARIFVPLRENEAVCVAASIKKPIHNVKEAGNSRILSAPGTRPIADKLLSSSLEYWFADSAWPSGVLKLVEPIGIEPMTPCLQSRCSPS